MIREIYIIIKVIIYGKQDENMQINIALCDDSKEALANAHYSLIKIFEQQGEIVEIELFESSQKLINEITKNNKQFDIIFMDMEMPELNGIEAGKIIRDYNKETIIIYITGFVDFAIHAFEVRALDYILKPININKLKKATLDAIGQIKKIEKNKDITDDYITIQSNKKVIRIKNNDIIFFEKAGNKVKIVCENNVFECYSSLKKIMKQIEGQEFAYTHQGYIINTKKMTHYEKKQIILNNNVKIPLSKAHEVIIKKIFCESLRG